MAQLVYRHVVCGKTSSRGRARLSGAVIISAVPALTLRGLFVLIFPGVVVDIIVEVGINEVGPVIYDLGMVKV